MTTCDVCGYRDRPARHRCRFEKACACWWSIPCDGKGQANIHPRPRPHRDYQDALVTKIQSRGQVLVEFALVAPVLLLLLLGASDVGIAGFQLLRMQNAAATIAAVPEAEAAELSRLGMACTATTSENEGVRLVVLECVNPLPLTGYVADRLRADASAPVEAPMT